MSLDVASQTARRQARDLGDPHASYRHGTLWPFPIRWTLQWLPGCLTAFRTVWSSEKTRFRFSQNFVTAIDRQTRGLSR